MSNTLRCRVRAHQCPLANAARNVEQKAFGEVSSYAEPSTNTVGTVYPELVPATEQTPVETRASAAPALCGKSCR